MAKFGFGEPQPPPPPPPVTGDGGKPARPGIQPPSLPPPGGPPRRDLPPIFSSVSIGGGSTVGGGDIPLGLALWPHGDTNYVNGDASARGQLRFYSQIMATGDPAGGGADTQILAGKHRLGGADYDIHFSAERVGGVNGTGVVFPDIDFKVAALLNAPARTAAEWRVLMDNNAAYMGFPEAGGVGTLYGKLKGGNGANLDLIGRIGGAAGSFIIEDNTGAQLLQVTNAGALIPDRLLTVPVGLVSGVSPALDAALGNYFRLSILTNIAVVIQAPSNTPGAGLSQELVIEIINASGGALTTAPTFATGANAYLFSAVTNPGNGLAVFYRFHWNSGRARWTESCAHLAAGI